MSREKQNAEIYKPMCEELFNNIEKQYQELAKVKAESEQIEEMAKLACTCFDGNCKGCPLDFYPPCPPKASATRLYNAGYRKQSEWISVDERLPEMWEKCLCYYPEKDYGSKVVVDYAETDNGGFAEQFKFGKPSHWMPLPEAPKKGGA